MFKFKPSITDKYVADFYIYNIEMILYDYRIILEKINY